MTLGTLRSAGWGQIQTEMPLPERVACRADVKGFSRWQGGACMLQAVFIHSARAFADWPVQVFAVLNGSGRRGQAVIDQ